MKGNNVFELSDIDNLDKLPVGTLVTQDVVDYFMDMMPPRNMTSFSAQLGEPYSMRFDSKVNQYRSTYLTFTREMYNIWSFCGDCFPCENVTRGNKPPYVKLN